MNVKENTMTKPKPLPPELLIKVGTCCGNKCLNCPYEPKHSKGNKTVQDKYKKVTT